MSKAIFILCAGLAGGLCAEPLQNIALGKACTFSRKPNYHLTRDDDDGRQLTDGKYAKDNTGCLWTRRDSVGWSGNAMGARITPKTVTVDLGADMPIRGFSWNLAFGSAGVTFPESIDIYVSSDGQEWHHVGDLLARAVARRIMPPPGYYNVYRAWADDMPCHGRYVMFLTVNAPYCFVDEIEVYRGDDALLARPMAGEPTKDPVKFHKTLLIRNRLLRDADEVGASGEIRAEVAKVQMEDFAPDFRTELPINRAQRMIFAANAARLRKSGLAKPAFWTNDRWENLSPVAVPPAEAVQVRELALEMMRGEVRGVTVNVANPTDAELTCDFTVEGFDGTTPVLCQEVVFTDMKYYRPNCSALRSGDGPHVRFPVPAGVSKQVWMSVRRPTGAAGVRRGRAVARLSDGTVLTVPLAVTVHGIDLPEAPALRVGGWDYLNGNGFAKSPATRRPSIEYLRQIGVNVAWAGKGAMPTKAAFDGKGELTGPLDFTAWDRWLRDFPGMRVYAVFANFGAEFCGEKIGTERCSRMMAAYFRAWRAHLRAAGFDGTERRVLLLPFDEPNDPRQADRILLSLRPIRAGGHPEIGAFMDPQFLEPEKIPAEFWDLCDVISPLYSQIEPSPQRMRFYAGLAAKGKEIWLYEAHGPSRIYDPVLYYRRQAWAAYALGSRVTGSQFWAFGCGGGIANSWTAYAQTRTEYSPYFVTPEGPMDAKQCEGIREGQEDFELLRLHEARFGRAETEKVVAAALEGLPYGNPDWDAPNRRHGLLDGLRVQMLRRLAGK